MAEKNTDYFQVPNDIFDEEIKINDNGSIRELRTTEKLVYIYLCRCSNNGNQAFPSYETISKKCGISRRKAIDIINLLDKNSLITKEVRRNKNPNRKSNQSNTYSIIQGSAISSLPETENPSNSAVIASPSATISPPVVQSVHQGSATIAPIKRNTQEEIIEKETHNNANLFNSLLGIWERQFKFKTGKDFTASPEDEVILSSFMENGITELAFHQQVKEYFNKRRSSYTLPNMINSP